MQLEALTALSPLDGRYHTRCAPLAAYFSEMSLFHYRIRVEIEWLEILLTEGLLEAPALSAGAKAHLERIKSDFSLEDARRIKEIEKETNHDVKAMEYYIKEKMAEHAELAPLKEFIHFACTSEDINNIAYAALFRDGVHQAILPKAMQLLDTLKTFALKFRQTPMLARTHGQAATPTTIGKEFANVWLRLKEQLHAVAATSLTAKCNGATGNFNAHQVAYPEANWPDLSQKLVGAFALTWQPLTTQIEPHDTLAQLLQAIVRVNTILIDWSRDCWSYISMGYFKQKMREHEVGSSTMPHKVNPIDFENAEGNLSLSSAILSFLAERLPISRWQRDLVDSTLLRNVGVGLSHAYLGMEMLLQGMGKIDIHVEKVKADLVSHWDVLTEAVQTVMRRYDVPEPYEQLKKLSRGKALSQAELHVFVAQLPIPNDARERLLALTPERYVGLAEALVTQILGD
jgi:adenylosuccinate lyase